VCLWRTTSNATSPEASLQQPLSLLVSWPSNRQCRRLATRSKQREHCSQNTPRPWNWLQFVNRTLGAYEAPALASSGSRIGAALGNAFNCNFWNNDVVHESPCKVIVPGAGHVSPNQTHFWLQSENECESTRIKASRVGVGVIGAVRGRIPARPVSSGNSSMARPYV